MKSKITLLLLLLAFTFTANAQDQDGANATFFSQATSMETIPSIASRTELAPATTKYEEMQDGRSSKNKVIPGKDPQIEDDYFARNPNRLSQKIPGRVPSIVFDAAQSNSTPTDPAGAVGPNHYVMVFNTGFRIFDKNGDPLTGQLGTSVIFPSGGCCDLTVSYDNAADRFVMTFLGSSVQVAVSQGPDPVNDGWFTYSFPMNTDYQKLSVWSDAYYMTANKNSGSASTSEVVYALERDKMLLGDPSAQIIGFPLPGITTSGFYSPQAFNVSNSNLPAAGNAPIVYLQDDAWGGVSEDHVKLWTVDVDFVTPANSTISAPQTIVTTPFISVFDGGSFVNLTQPNGGSSVDALQATIMNQAQFRKFGDHNSAIFNFVVDTDASSAELAGVRWFELRQDNDGQPWSLYQEGTYTSPDGKHAWHASMVMDIQGNIGMGYTAMGGTTNQTLSSYYTGRFANDPLNTMTVIEELIAAGGGNIPSTRYGDYSKIDVDPADDKTFWFINEYFNGGRKDVVGVFKIAPNFNNDLGVVSIDTPANGTLTNAESITITVFNFGENSQSNIPVSLVVDGVTLANEVFAGPVASNTSEQYTFTATADFSTEGQTYVVEASTNLSGDEDPDNDSVTRNITHIFAKDIGVTEITSPNDGENLGNEDVTITIQNFGAAAQSNFDVSYKIQGQTEVVETVVGPLAPGATISYTFNQQGDFSNVVIHTLTAKTLLAGDSVPSNNAVTKTVANYSCSSETNSTTQPIGPNQGTVTESVISITDDFVINDVNVTLNLTHTFDGDLDIFLIAPDGTPVELSTDNGGSGENFTNTVFDDSAATSITTGSAPFTGSFKPEGSLSTFNGMQSLGDWTLSITDDANSDGGTLLDWSLQICEESILSTFDNILEDADLLVISEGNNHFKIQFPTKTITEQLTFSVTNMLGQTLASYNLDNETGKGYEYDLDMSYAASGVYLIRLGNNEMSKVKRIIVK